MNSLRPLVFSLALLLLFVSQAAAAPHEGYYVGAYYGLSSLNSLEGKDDLGRFNLDSDPGELFTLTLGYDLPRGGPLGEGRLELAYTRSSNDITQASFSDAAVSADGTLEVQSLLLNSFLNLPGSYAMTPYLGVGIGAAQVKMDKLTAAAIPLIDDDSLVFAGQAGCGIGWQIATHLRLDLGYRYFASMRPELKEADGRTVKLKLNAHRLQLGLVLLF